MTTNAPETLTLVGGNLNFGRRRRAQQRDVNNMRNRGADVIATCEDVRDGKRRERVIVTKPGKLNPFQRGGIRAALNRRGLKIGWRFWRFVDIKPTGMPAVRIVSGHMPPHRFRRVLGPVYARRLRRLLRRGPRLWAVHADWNQLLSEDPANLQRDFGAKPFGRRIDGWIVHPDLAQYVTDVDIESPRPRGDNHVYTYVTLTWWPR